MTAISARSAVPTMSASTDDTRRDPATRDPATRSAGLWAFGLLLAQFVLVWTTFFVLSSSIDWPRSLGDPASVVLPRLLDNLPAVVVGYGAYLLSALLLVPATAALNARLGLTGGLAQATLGLAVLSAIAKAIGIGRWLFVMPELATAYVAPGADTGTLSLIYEALNAYAGGIGEVIGVALVSGAWSLVVALVLLRRPGVSARVAGIVLGLGGVLLWLSLVERFGIDLDPVLTLSNIVWQFGLLAAAIHALLARR